MYILMYKKMCKKITLDTIYKYKKILKIIILLNGPNGPFTKINLKLINAKFAPEKKIKKK